jgi:hypothetical protein
LHALGDRGQAWFEFLTDPATHSPVLLFHYPSTQPDGFAYLKRSVKLEFGSLTNQQPTGRHPVTPWIADVLPEAFADWKCKVVALEMQWTFWEKATILHTEYHRPADKPTPDRFSRHYADTAALASHPDASKAAGDNELCSRVAQWKTAEHWMMAGKARLFGDDNALVRNLDAPIPRPPKHLDEQYEASTTRCGRRTLAESSPKGMPVSSARTCSCKRSCWLPAML